MSKVLDNSYIEDVDEDEVQEFSETVVEQIPEEPEVVPEPVVEFKINEMKADTQRNMSKSTYKRINGSKVYNSYSVRFDPI